MPIFVVSIVLQVILVIHVIKTGRTQPWIWIVLIFPLIGGLAYLVVEVLPELGSSRAVRSANRKWQEKVDPHRDVRISSQALAIADTLDNTLKLARALREKGQFDDALTLYERACTGMYANDPHLLLGKAELYFLKGDFTQTRSTLEQLIAANPDFKSADGHLLYARSLELLGEVAAADHEYEALSRYYPGPEAKCRYGQFLQQQGRHEEAQRHFSDVLAVAAHSGKHYHRLYKEWVALAKKSVS